MINAVTGVPGEGKTCFSVQHIILKELMVGDRPIYSNVAWHDEEVIKYCLSFGYTVDPARLNTLSEDQISNFWEHCPKNCLIVLDEVGEFFNAQAWKQIGTKAGSYARQHRKLGHETYLIVQCLNHIYKQFRDMVYEEIRIVNLSNRRIGPFKMPKFFLAKWIVKDMNEVQKSRLYRFNLDVFSTYSTLATVGGLLESADPVEVKANTKKLTFKELKRKAFGFLGDHWFAIFVILVVGFILLAPKLIFNGFSSDTEEQIYTEKPKLKTDDQKHIKKPAIFDISTQLEGRTTNAKNSATYHRGRFDSNSKRSLRPEDSL